MARGQVSAYVEGPTSDRLQHPSISLDNKEILKSTCHYCTIYVGTHPGWFAYNSVLNRERPYNVMHRRAFAPVKMSEHEADNRVPNVLKKLYELTKQGQLN
jgi:hypothetical protein